MISGIELNICPRLNARALLRTKQSETVTFGGTSLSDNTAATSHELHKVRASNSSPGVRFTLYVI